MDNKEEAISMLEKIKVSYLQSDNNNKINGDEEIPNNPLETVLFEILNIEIAIPTLQYIESILGESDVSFCGFLKSDQKGSVKLLFSNPSMELESNLGNETMAEQVAKTYINEEKEPKLALT
ncbi:hypothetical protein [Staphylococcus hominis]|uniref:hypothetical protein n=1 Tax=Staphylococcus hominis TaxID=1290 RepID=UPI001F583597|nr:hypothetical protein [Staphylococcus hominis]MCI2910899.1 hypothetical protein [Staphylococcus hominis]